MKYNRRGFIALAAVMSASPSFGQKGTLYASLRHKTPIEKFKKLFGLKSHFLPRELTKIFSGQFETFKVLGYKNQFKGCLMNSEKTYAICPLAIPVSQNNANEVFLMFTKGENWSFVGSFNQYESELFLAISEKLQTTKKDFHPEKLLPKTRIIDGLENPFVADDNTYSFSVKLNEGSLQAKVIFRNRETIEESVNMIFRG